MAWWKKVFASAAPSVPARGPAPDNASLAADWKAQGNAALGRGDLAEAARCYTQGSRADPSEPTLHLNLGFVLLEQGACGEAAQRLAQALALGRPGDDFVPDAHFLLGRAHAAAGRPAEALRSCESAVQAKPDFPEALEEGVRALHALQRHREAADWAGRLLALRRTPFTQWLLAQELSLAGEGAEAARVLERLCAEEPANREASQLLCRVLFTLRQYEAAAAEAERFLAIAGPDAASLVTLAAARGRLGRLDEALAALDQALAQEPGRQDALVNRAAILCGLGRVRESVACAQEGLRHHPQNADLHWNLSVGHLLLGEFEAGWREHEWRHHDGALGAPTRLAQPRWRGESLQGRSIFLYGEQGFGDNIQFLRFVPEIARQAGRVYLLVLQALEPLLADLPANCERVPAGAPAPLSDYECPLMSLPAVLGTTEQDIPRVIPYLRAEPAAVRAWRARLPADRLNVGIAWAGKPTHHNDLNRSMALDAILQLAAPGCRLVTVQPQLREADRQALAAAPDVVDAGRDLRDFGETAALLQALDGVVSVDTSVAHLAGALGRPVFLLLPFVPDWRWMLEREDSPWYPTARLFRQPAIGDWHPVLERVRVQLAQLALASRGAAQ